MTDVEQLRRHSLWLSRLTLFLLVATALLIIVPTLYGFTQLERFGMRFWPVLIRALVLWSPTVFYLYSLWAIRGGFQSFAAGGVFGPAIAAGCTRAGVALAIGATLSAVGLPNMMNVLRNAGLLEGLGPSFSGVLIFDTAYLAVGVVGLALILLGRLLARAAEIQADAARMQDELGGFF